MSGDELSIKGESVQRVYNHYLNQRFIINRRYQRKLVWTIEEKMSLIDSLLNGLPVPLILLATKSGTSTFEVIDGMQRLNAIASFIEGEFSLDGEFFDLETMVESKSLLDTGKIHQKTPKLARAACEKIATYTLPISTSRFDGSHTIDEVFRRINSSGRHLSRQDLRSAGTISTFSQVVKEIASSVRGDVSNNDILPLNSMKEISITNRNLPYGINVENVFWVSEGILTREAVRQSKDEEVVADLIAQLVFDKPLRSNNTTLDEYYGVGSSVEKMRSVERQLQKHGATQVNDRFLRTLDAIKAVVKRSGKTFRQLLMNNDEFKLIPKYFQVIFLAFAELIFDEGKEISDLNTLVANLEGVGRTHINITRGGTWSAKNRQDNVGAIRGIIQSCFTARESEDPARDVWITQFENILMQSFTEQSLYDFKQGFCNLAGNCEFNEKAFKKVIKTLTAMANHSKEATGYVLVGVADSAEMAERVKRIHSIDPHQYNKFYITGIGHEPSLLGKDIDQYFSWITHKISTEPISDNFKSQVSRSIKLIKYFDKLVMVFEAKGQSDPESYDNNYYERHGSNVEKVENIQNLFRRFYKGE